MIDYRGLFLNEWHLERNGQPFNPFMLQPPETPEERAAVFTGPESDLESAASQLLAAPCGIVVHGIFGVGKTMFAYEALRRSEKARAIPVYVSYHSQENFYLLILREIARALAERGNDEGKKIDAILRRGEQSLERKTGGEFSPEAAGIRVGSLGREVTQVEALGIQHPRSEIERLADAIKPGHQRIIIAVDNLERYANEEQLRQVVNDVKELQRFGCSVMLIGHPLGVTRNLTSASEGGVFADTILLEPLSAAQLVEMATKYLRLARRPNSDLAPTHPFTPIAVRDVAERTVAHNLTPRSFHYACHFFLEYFSKRGEHLILPDHLDEGFAALSRKIGRNLVELEMEDQDIRYRDIVRATHIQGRLTEEPDDAALESLNTTFLDERPRLVKLEESDVIIGETQVDQGGSEIRQYRVNPLLHPEDIDGAPA